MCAASSCGRRRAASRARPADGTGTQRHRRWATRRAADRPRDGHVTTTSQRPAPRSGNTPPREGQPPPGRRRQIGPRQARSARTTSRPTREGQREPARGAQHRRARPSERGTSRTTSRAPAGSEATQHNIQPCAGAAKPTHCTQGPPSMDEVTTSGQPRPACVATVTSRRCEPTVTAWTSRVSGEDEGVRRRSTNLSRRDDKRNAHTPEQRTDQRNGQRAPGRAGAPKARQRRRAEALIYMGPMSVGVWFSGGR